MKINKKQKQFLEENFKVDIINYSNGKYLSLEDWTSGGVDMIIEIDYKKDLIVGLNEYIENFDIDEEIDLYRENKDYRENFTISESLKDFENWISRIKTIKNVLEVLK